MRPLVLLHGFTGSPASLGPVVDRLDGARCTIPALVGHDPRLDDDRSVESFDAEVARLARRIAARGAGPVHVAGYSLGARLALGLLSSRPELFASATLIGVHPGLTSPSEITARRLADQAWCELLEREGIAAFVAAWEAQPLFGSQSRLSPAARAAQRAIRLSHSPDGLARALRATGLGGMPDLHARLARVTPHVDVVVGELDEKFRALAAPLVASLPDASLEVVSNAGHNLPLECPDAVARAIARGALT